MAPCYHIRWSRDGKLDWECHLSQAEAEKSARELTRPGERYTIEKCRHAQSEPPEPEPPQWHEEI